MYNVMNRLFCAVYDYGHRNPSPAEEDAYALSIAKNDALQPVRQFFTRTTIEREGQKFQVTSFGERFLAAATLASVFAMIVQKSSHRFMKWLNYTPPSFALKLCSEALPRVSFSICF